MKYVVCQSCINWDDDQRINKDCYLCKGKRIVKDPEERFCNKCAGRLCPTKGNINYQSPDGLVDAKVVGGPESTHLSDMVAYHFSLCELCLRHLFNECLIPPEVQEYNSSNFDDIISYQTDRDQYEYSEWKKTDKFIENYKNKICNCAKDCKNEAKFTILNGSQTFSEDCCCEPHKENYKNHNWVKLVPFISNTLKSFI